jgi:hypothetical protein
VEDALGIPCDDSVLLDPNTKVGALVNWTLGESNVFLDDFKYGTDVDVNNANAYQNALEQIPNEFVGAPAFGPSCGDVFGLPVTKDKTTCKKYCMPRTDEPKCLPTNTDARNAFFAAVEAQVSEQQKSVITRLTPRPAAEEEDLIIPVGAPSGPVTFQQLNQSQSVLAEALEKVLYTAGQLQAPLGADSLQIVENGDGTISLQVTAKTFGSLVTALARVVWDTFLTSVAMSASSQSEPMATAEEIADHVLSVVVRNGTVAEHTVDLSDFVTEAEVIRLRELFDLTTYDIPSGASAFLCSSLKTPCGYFNYAAVRTAPAAPLLSGSCPASVFGLILLY